MNLTLRPFRAKDLDLLGVWSRTMDLSPYMSRCRPRDQAATGHDPAGGLLWFVIVADGRDAGTLWLEPGSHPNQAVLGIFLAREELLGQGLGTRAIRLALDILRERHPKGMEVVLNVREANTRAIACYKACGFKVISTGLKRLTHGEDIPVIRMQLARKTETLLPYCPKAHKGR